MSPSEGTLSYNTPEHLSHELCVELWARVIERLEGREVFTANLHFQIAIEEEFQELTGKEPDEDTKSYIRRMVQAVNTMHPQTYLAQGVQNGIARAFEEGARRLKWDVAKIQANGSRAIRRFSRTDSVRDLLQDVNVRIDHDALLECVNDAVEALATQHAPSEDATRVREEARLRSHEEVDARRLQAEQAARAHREQAQAAATAAAQAPVSSQQRAADSIRDLMSEGEVQQAIDAGEIDRDQLSQQVREQQGRSEALREQEGSKIIQNLPKYVERGVLTQDEADKVKALHELDQKVRRGEISEQEAAQVRNSYMDGSARSALESKVRDAVDGVVRYLEIFEGLKRISPEYDPAMEFLVQHKTVVTAEEGSSVDSSAALGILMEEKEILDRILDISERKDHEVRLIAIRLPPYMHTIKRGLEKITNMTIEVKWVDELRVLMYDDMSDRLNSPNKLERVRSAADMNCMINLLDHCIKRTRFRKELRVIKLSRVLEDLYRNSDNAADARRQAETYINMRLRRLFPDLSLNESNEIKARGKSIIDSVESKVLGERAREKEERLATPAKKQVYSTDTQGGEDLSEDERQKGVVIGRVEMRVAGSTKRVPQKIMPDPDDEERMVVATRDSASDELVPQIRRGQKRYVERDREGIWQIVTN